MQWKIWAMSNHVITIYDIGERITSVWLKFRFQNNNGSCRKFPMRDASMSRWTIWPYLMGLLGYAIKIAATWVAGKNCETFYFLRDLLLLLFFYKNCETFKSLGKKVARNKNSCNKYPTTTGSENCSCLQLS